MPAWAACCCPSCGSLGYTIPDFDFAIPGVTSMSCDLHKYGYAAKGASVILYRNSALRRHMFFSYINWSGGVYVSPTMTGTRPGGPIAAAWAIMNFLGEEGYLKLADVVMQTVRKIREGIASLPEVRVLSNPDMSVLAIASDKLDVYQIGDELTARGWHLDRQQFPPSLHMTIVPAHALVVDQFLDRSQRRDRSGEETQRPQSDQQGHGVGGQPLGESCCRKSGPANSRRNRRRCWARRARGCRSVRRRCTVSSARCPIAAI